MHILFIQVYSVIATSNWGAGICLFFFFLYTISSVENKCHLKALSYICLFLDYNPFLFQKYPVLSSTLLADIAMFKL